MSVLQIVVPMADRGSRFANAGYAMQFGPSSLPICADCLLFCKLAARHGASGLARPGVNFFIHAARFSSELPGKRRETFRETFRYLAGLGVTAWHERWRFPVTGYLRQFRAYWKND